MKEPVLFFLIFFIILLIIFINNFKILKLSVFVCSLFLVLILLNLNTPFKKRLIDRTLNHTKIFDKNSKIIIFSKNIMNIIFLLLECLWIIN